MFNDELKKTYEALSGGIRFNSFNDISNNQIRELALAWSENREPQFGFDPRHVLTKDPNAWEARFYFAFDNNPFVIPAELRQVRNEIESHISHLFRDVWAKEKRTFKYWYDLERQKYQEHLRESIIKNRRDRIQAIGIPA